MRKIMLLALALPIALSACATTGTTVGSVQLDADKAFATAQISFKTLEQVALAGIKSGAITGSLKAKVIALADRGQAFENQGYAAQRIGSHVAEAAAVTNLTDIVAQLRALGLGN